MSPADLDVARELAAHPRWEWRPGVRIADYGPGIRYCWQDETHLHGAAEEGGSWMRIRIHKGTGVYVPDLDDPTGATAGVLLAMLRELTEHVTATVVYAGGWQLCANDREYEGATLASAVARALLAAWGPA